MDTPAPSQPESVPTTPTRIINIRVFRDPISGEKVAVDKDTGVEYARAHDVIELYERLEEATR